MTDINEMSEGQEIEAVVRLTVAKNTDSQRFWDKLVVKDNDGATLTSLAALIEIAESITIVRPEIIPGQPYVDAAGLLYVGRYEGRVMRVDELSNVQWYGPGESLALPAGLRPAKVVPVP